MAAGGEPQSVEALQARVAALRKLANSDVVPAVQEIIQTAMAGQPFTLFRTVAGAGRALGYKKTFDLQLPVPDGPSRVVSEAAVVFGATACAVPAATWRGAKVVELGCGSAYVGVLLAALGARVTLTDRPEMAAVAAASVGQNGKVIRVPASASFAAWDWARPRDEDHSSMVSVLRDIAEADIIVAAEPATDEHSERDFLVAVRALLGLDGAPMLARSAREFVVAHKHQQSFCISGYAAPVEGARPTITQADQCERCQFKRSLEDCGVQVTPWERTPSDFQHAFIECWSLRPARRS